MDRSLNNLKAVLSLYFEYSFIQQDVEDWAKNQSYDFVYALDANVMDFALAPRESTHILKLWSEQTMLNAPEKFSPESQIIYASYLGKKILNGPLKGEVFDKFIAYPSHLLEYRHWIRKMLSNVQKNSVKAMEEDIETIRKLTKQISQKLEAGDSAYTLIHQAVPHILNIVEGGASEVGKNAAHFKSKYQNKSDTREDYISLLEEQFSSHFRTFFTQIKADTAKTSIDVNVLMSLMADNVAWHLDPNERKYILLTFDQSLISLRNAVKLGNMELVLGNRKIPLKELLFVYDAQLLPFMLGFEDWDNWLQTESFLDEFIENLNQIIDHFSQYNNDQKTKEKLLSQCTNMLWGPPQSSRNNLLVTEFKIDKDLEPGPQSSSSFLTNLSDLKIAPYVSVANNALLNAITNIALKEIQNDPSYQENQDKAVNDFLNIFTSEEVDNLLIDAIMKNVKKAVHVYRTTRLYYNKEITTLIEKLFEEKELLKKKKNYSYARMPIVLNYMNSHFFDQLGKLVKDDQFNFAKLLDFDSMSPFEEKIAIAYCHGVLGNWRESLENCHQALAKDNASTENKIEGYLLACVATRLQSTLDLTDLKNALDLLDKAQEHYDTYATEITECLSYRIAAERISCHMCAQNINYYCNESDNDTFWSRENIWNYLIDQNKRVHVALNDRDITERHQSFLKDILRQNNLNVCSLAFFQHAIMGQHDFHMEVVNFALNDLALAKDGGRKTYINDLIVLCAQWIIDKSIAQSIKTLITEIQGLENYHLLPYEKAKFNDILRIISNRSV